MLIYVYHSFFPLVQKRLSMHDAAGIPDLYLCHLDGAFITNGMCTTSWNECDIDFGAFFAANPEGTCHLFEAVSETSERE